MNNYIILENRAELTTAQVLGGMNFSAIVAGAASASSDAFGGSSFGTGFISKGFIAVLIVVGGVAVYKNYTTYKDESSFSYTEINSDENIIKRDGSKGPLLMMETIPPKNNKFLNENPNMACQPAGSNHEGEENLNHMTSSTPYLPLANIDSLIAIEDALKADKTLTNSPASAQMVLMPGQLSCRKEGESVGNQMTEELKILNTTLPFKGSPNAKSYLWQPATFNHNVEEASGQFKMDCNNCEFDYVSGSRLDNKNYKGVWMRVTRDKKARFKLESGLKNISLIRTEGIKTIVFHPKALGIDGPQWREKEWTYISDKFKTNSATCNFGDYIDVYMIFEDAKVGDKVVIDDFVETVVVEK